jgi:hypothetical protein
MLYTYFLWCHDTQPNDTHHNAIQQMTLRRRGLHVTIIINDTQYTTLCRYGECHVLFIVMLNVVMLSDIMFNVVMLSVLVPFFTTESGIK